MSELGEDIWDSENPQRMREVYKEFANQEYGSGALREANWLEKVVGQNMADKYLEGLAAFKGDLE